MKKIIFQFAAITIVAISCKKDSVTVSPLSQWTFAGISYKGFAKSYPSGGEFSAFDSLSTIGLPQGNFVAINFGWGYIPSKNGIYKVKQSPGSNTECRVTVGYLGNGPLLNYASVDSTSEISITVSPEGKISAFFAGIFLSNYNRTEIRTVSGKLVEQ